MTRLKFVTNALIAETEVNAGDVYEIPDDEAKGYIERGTARDVDGDAEAYAQSDALAASMQPNVIDQALVNSGFAPDVHVETPAEVETDQSLTPPQGEGQITL